MLTLEINYKEKKKTAKNTNSLEQNNMLLNNQWIIEEIKDEIKRHLETDDNKDTTTPNLWDIAKALLRGNFIEYHLSQERKKNSI